MPINAPHDVLWDALTDFGAKQTARSWTRVLMPKQFGKTFQGILAELEHHSETGTIVQKRVRIPSGEVHTVIAA